MTDQLKAIGAAMILIFGTTAYIIGVWKLAWRYSDSILYIGFIIVPLLAGIVLILI
jgi:uncharacterized membrane protein YiaA